jgi:hypothetical protein
MANKKKQMQQPPQYGVGGDVLSGALTGAGTGMALGPWGAAAGAVVGGVTGLLGGIGEKKAEDAAMNDQARAAYMAQADITPGGGGYVPTFCRGGKVRKYPDGGYIQPGTAELEQGEVYMTPDGNVQRILESAPKHGQKAKSGATGVRLNLPPGTKILSNRKIDPMSGKPFAHEATKDSKLRDKAIEQLKKGNKYAKAAAERNLANLDKKFNAAFDRQEAGKPKKSIDKFAMGGEVPKYFNGDQTPFMLPGVTATPTQNLLMDYDYNPGAGNNFHLSLGNEPNPLHTPLPGGAAGFFNQEQPVTPATQATTGGGRKAATAPTPLTNTQGMFNADGMFGSAARQGFQNVGQSVASQGFTPDTLPGTSGEALKAVGATGAPGVQGAGLGFGQKLKGAFGSGSIGGGILGTAAQLAPTIYNAIQGIRKPTQRDPKQFQNPQYNQAINLMANRRFNVDPILEANRNAMAIGRYNLSNMGASAGQAYAGTQGLVASRMRADAAAYAQKQNVDNQYLAQEAQMRAGLGSEEALNRYRTDQDNLAAQAMRRTHQGTAASQLSQWSQMQQLMKGQERRDLRLEKLIGNMGPYAAQWAGLA